MGVEEEGRGEGCVHLRTVIMCADLHMKLNLICGSSTDGHLIQPHNWFSRLFNPHLPLEGDGDQRIVKALTMVSLRFI